MYDEQNYERGGHHRGPRREHHGHGSGERRGVPLANLPPELTEVSRKLIGSAIEVHKTLGPGYAKDVYAAALMHEISAAGIAHQYRSVVPISYKGTKVGEQIADLLIDNRFIVQLLAQRGEIGGMERAALRGLLRQADLELGLIINFSERRLKDGLVRVLNPDKLNLGSDESGEEADDMGDGH